MPISGFFCAEGFQGEHMRMRYYGAALLAGALALAGCGKTVEVVQADHFRTMVHRMPQELIARGVIDDSRSYMASLWDRGEDYGQALFTRFVPDFLFEDAVGGGAEAASFAAGVKPDDHVRRHDAGFAILGMRRDVKVDMIAVTDWDGDGSGDWLVSCLVESRRGGKSRDYYVVVSDPPADGPLRGVVAAVYESFGLAGKLYLRESKAGNTPKGRAGDEEMVEETVPGLRPVTAPPASRSGGEERKGGIQERNL